VAGILVLKDIKRQTPIHSGASCPWSPWQIVILSWMTVDFALAYGFVMWYSGYPPCAVFWIHAALLAIFVVLVLWLELSEPRATELEITPQNAKTKTTPFTYCKQCKMHIDGHNRKHCWQCKTCTTGHDHHCPYLNICVSEYNYTPWLTSLWVFVTVLLFQLAQSVPLLVNLKDHHSSEYETADEEIGIGVAWVLCYIAVLGQLALLFFFADLGTMHLRFTILQQIENKKAEQEHRAPMFISTRKMFRLKYDDEEKKNLLEGAVRVWILMEQTREARGNCVQAFVDLWKFRKNAEEQPQEIHEIQRLHLWAMGVQDASEQAPGNASALHQLVRKKSTRIKNTNETMPRSILIRPGPPIASNV